MNDIFKFFKKRSNKDKNINDILNEYNENEVDQNQTNFDRASRSYVSMSKSGRLKAKKSNQRGLKDDIFQPQGQHQQPTSSQKQLVDQNSDNADSSASSVSGSSSESLRHLSRPQRPYATQQSHQQEQLQLQYQHQQQQQQQQIHQRMSTGGLNSNAGRGYRY